MYRINNSIDQIRYLYQTTTRLQPDYNQTRSERTLRTRTLEGIPHSATREPKSTLKASTRLRDLDFSPFTQYPVFTSRTPKDRLPDFHIDFIDVVLKEACKLLQVGDVRSFGDSGGRRHCALP